MKRSMQWVGLVALCALPFAAQAQSTKAISFGASGGLSVPMGDLSDGVEAGYSVAGHVFLKPASSSALSFRGDVAYDSWGAKGLAGSVADGSFSSLAFTGNVLFGLGDASAAMKPYIIGGGGLYRTKSSGSFGGFEVSASDNNLGIQGGAGLEFKLSGFSTFLEAKFVNVFSEDNSTTYVPITFGIKF